MQPKDWFRLDGRVALVTGAATGLGQAISVALGGRGARVAVSDKPGVSTQQTASLVAAQGAEVLAVDLDITDQQQISAAVARVMAECGRLDIVVNNAGINRPVSGLEATPETWDEHFAVNVKGGFFVAQAAAHHMIAQGWGRVIFISSQSGLVGVPGQPVYCSSKGAIINLVRTLAVEWARHGVTVNAIAPTFIETNLTRKRLENPEFREYVLKQIPGGKLAQPEDVAAAAVFLASDQAGMVTGTTLSVDGGWTAW
ncbi:MAG: glucose 1-dehydrogenase [Armatimonadetes bacterium]|nr:glucose 1-dehydrogenase [Armatimonadota bacterium]